MHESLQAALAAARCEPLHETAHRTIARVLLDEGNVVEAVKRYRLFMALLDRELGRQPSDYFTRLMRPYLGSPPCPSPPG